MPDAIPARINPAPHPSSQLSGKYVHLVGIGGCGMSGAARMLLQQGAIVSGSDRDESTLLMELSQAGATVCVGHSASNLDSRVDFVVASAAVPEDNPELLAARAQDKPILKYARLLGLLMESTCGVAISGTHGKSTTTAMTAFCARETGLDPSFIVGAEVDQLGGGAGVGRGGCFIAEACEYDRSYLNLAPTHAAILNVEEDHLDYFDDLKQILAAFREFAALVPNHGVLLFNEDDPASRLAVAESGARCESFGFTRRADWRARRLDLSNGLPRFELWYHGDRIGEATLAIPGKHNVYNAIVAVALSVHCGADPADALASVARFTGVSRRLTHRGAYREIDILDDYAHHPTEIRATLKAVRDRFGRRPLRVIFQPHQHSRTRFFLNDFAQSFALADEVIVPDIYFVRDSTTERQLVSGGDLVECLTRRGGRAVYIPALDDIAAYLARTVRAEDIVLTMGAGDVWKVADEMVIRLGRSD